MNSVLSEIKEIQECKIKTLRFSSAEVFLSRRFWKNWTMKIDLVLFVDYRVAITSIPPQAGDQIVIGWKMINVSLASKHLKKIAWSPLNRMKESGIAREFGNFYNLDHYVRWINKLNFLLFRWHFIGALIFGKSDINRRVYLDEEDFK